VALDGQTSRGLLETASALAHRAPLVAVAGLPLIGVALVMPTPLGAFPFLTGGCALLALAALLRVLSAAARGQLAQRRAALVSLCEHDAAPVFVTDADGELIWSNRSAHDRFHARAAQTLSGALGDLFASPSAVLYRLQNTAHARGHAQEDVVTRRGHLRVAVHRMDDGHYVWRLEETGDRGPGRSGEAASLPMLTASKSGTVLFVNESMRRLLGQRPSTLDRVVPELPVKSGAVHRITARDGPVHVRIVPVEASAGRTEYYFLQMNEEGAGDHGALFDGLPVPALMIRPGGEVVAANRLARDLFAVRDAEGLTMARLLEGPGRGVADWLADAFEGRGLMQPEVLRAQNTQTETYLQVTLSRVVENGEPMLVALLTDATELKTLEAKFVQSQKMQAIGQLAGGVAHDFNNLLTAISGHCDLLLLRHDSGDPDYADLVQIHQNANRAASLVGQLLAFSRKQSQVLEVLDLRDLLSDLTHLLNRLVGEKVTLSLAHDCEVAPIRADRRQLEQVFMNLVVNARDAMKEGGVITVETEHVVLEDPLVRDRARVPAGEYMVVRVSDQGSGIPPDRIDKIFEPFYTTKRVGEGTGLGLSTAYGIVKQTGGFIFVDSVPGSGSCFTLYFPVSEVIEPVAPDPKPERPRAPGRDGSGVVLLVEDEAPVRAFASRALRMRGYTVIEAENAEQALEALDDPGLNVDIFVTDVIMPGMDGPTWVQKALETRPGVKVVFVSGYAEDHFAEDQARIPNSVFLPKPFTLSDLTATVQGQIH
jgi:two-component system, cell cycle sensor histidine kinase and response regulator CckA